MTIDQAIRAELLRLRIANLRRMADVALCRADQAMTIRRREQYERFFSACWKRVAALRGGK